ncbi:MAG: NAD(P)-binding domain-containing protein [Planctomycetota bacterium]
MVWVTVWVVAILVYLAVWQRRIEGRRRERIVAEIREARALGADRAVGQYPRVDPFRCIGCAVCVRACPEKGVLGMVNGVACLVRPAGCVGHGACQDACPVGALSVDLHDLASRPDIPRLTADLETTIPGLYIAGELGGLALIRHAIDQGARAVGSIADKMNGTATPPGIADVLVVGAGPSGLSATLKAIERDLSYVTIDQDDIGGTVRKYPRRKLALVQPVALPLDVRLRRREYVKEELIDIWERVIERHGVAIRSGVKLLGVARPNGHFESQTTAGPIRSRAVVLALGRRGTPRKLGVPGEEHEKVLYQLVDAAACRAERHLVVGGGDSAIEAATALAEQPGNEVTLSYRRAGFFRLKARNTERIRKYAELGRVHVLLASHVERIEPDRVHLRVEGDTPASASRVSLPNDRVFVFAGGEPPFPLLKRIGIGFGAEPPAVGAEPPRRVPA